MACNDYFTPSSHFEHSKERAPMVIAPQAASVYNYRSYRSSSQAEPVEVHVRWTDLNQSSRLGLGVDVDVAGAHLL